MSFQPTEDRIACHLIDGSVTESGLQIIRHDLREEMMEATVISVGPDCLSVKAGDTILLPRYSTADLDIEIEGQPLSLTRESEVIAILN
jgi:co-chaperonin GroES (HSP10)